MYGFHVDFGGNVGKETAIAAIQSDGILYLQAGGLNANSTAETVVSYEMNRCQLLAIVIEFHTLTDAA